MVVLYTINCPKCKVLELKLTKANIAFTTVSDPDKVIETGNAHGINSAPILQVGDVFYNFQDAVKYINEGK